MVMIIVIVPLECSGHSDIVYFLTVLCDMFGGGLKIINLLTQLLTTSCAEIAADVNMTFPFHQINHYSYMVKSFVLFIKMFICETL